ncbi:type II secretion system protein [Candidatus Gottesmanbacteria bacterium]|nr:type II secretion system protein [Candidatus Gottesmanbacteria bacterium]
MEINSYQSSASSHQLVAESSQISVISHQLSADSCKLKAKNGFTLLEILIALGVISLLGVVIVQVFFTTTRSNTKTELVKDVKQQADYAIGTMARSIQNARLVVSSDGTSCSSAGTVTPAIIITAPDSSQTTYGCVTDSLVQRIASTSATGTEYLTGTGYTLGGTSCSDASLSFVCTTIPGTSSSVRIVFTLSQKGTPQSVYEKANTTIETTVSMRN